MSIEYINATIINTAFAVGAKIDEYTTPWQEEAKTYCHPGLSKPAFYYGLTSVILAATYIALIVVNQLEAFSATSRVRKWGKYLTVPTVKYKGDHNIDYAQRQGSLKALEIERPQARHEAKLLIAARDISNRSYMRSFVETIEKVVAMSLVLPYFTQMVYNWHRMRCRLKVNEEHLLVTVVANECPNKYIIKTNYGQNYNIGCTQQRRSVKNETQSLLPKMMDRLSGFFAKRGI